MVSFSYSALVLLVQVAIIEASPFLAGYPSVACTDPGDPNPSFAFEEAASFDFKLCNPLKGRFTAPYSGAVKFECAESISSPGSLELGVYVYTDALCATIFTEYKMTAASAVMLFAGSCAPLNQQPGSPLSHLKLSPARVDASDNPCAGVSIASAGVSGDPVTHFAGIEHKFVLPNGIFTTLLQTKDLIIQASAFQGQAADEQWIEVVRVYSAVWALIVNVTIRRDIAKFNRTAETPGTLETMEVRAPWLHDHLLTFPLADDAVVQHGSLTYAWHHDHPHNVSFQLFRVEQPYGIHESTPRIEGVLLLCDSLKLQIVSSSALEYYYDDIDVERAKQFSHLDFELWDMKAVSTFGGLLPEVWGVKPGNNQESSSSAKLSHPQTLRSQTNMLATEQKSLEKGESARESSRELTRMILTNLLYPRSMDDQTSAVVCTGLQCFPSSEETV